MKGHFFLSISIILLLAGCVPDKAGTNEKSGQSGDAGTPEELIYTKHARCRMDCRHISEAEVQEILHNGKQNTQKSKPNDLPCATTALEGLTSDNQQVRVIVAECEPTRKIVTVIDLGTDWECSCR